MKRRTTVNIDWQNDFMDIPTEACPHVYNPITSQYELQVSPALAVRGATEDAKRFKEWMLANLNQFSAHYFTQDSHHILDISHPAWFNQAELRPDGTRNFQNRVPVNPFTPISLAEVEQDIYRPNLHRKRTLAYLRELEANGEFGHFIWTVHCVMGTWGHGFYSDAMDVIRAMEANGQWPQFITKGSNPYTEHFGAFRANVPDPDDSSTQFDQVLLKTLLSFDEVFVTGQARSHCVANSLRQLIQEVPALAPKLFVVEDCMSDVPGLPQDFYDSVNKIYADAKAMGVNFVTTTNFKF